MTYTRQDFVSDQAVRWCPGCGDYAILSTLQKTLPQLGVPKENIVLVSGIGCAGRMPYYIDTYGLHTLHGRAPAFATGLKLARPELSVWVITGDGDALSIGTNHLLHALRRNIDINILLLNNRIYGLTKGQYSPTSQPQHITPTSPFGSQEAPLNPLKVALSAGCGFVAKSLDNDHATLSEIILAAHAHPGTSFTEILQNCHVFHDRAFGAVRDKATQADHGIWLREGQGLTLKSNTHWLDLSGPTPEVKPVPETGVPSDHYLHDPHTISEHRAYQLACCADEPNLPHILGVYRAQGMRPAFKPAHTTAIGDATTFDAARSKLNAALTCGETWEIK